MRSQPLNEWRTRFLSAHQKATVQESKVNYPPVLEYVGACTATLQRAILSVYQSSLSCKNFSLFPRSSAARPPEVFSRIRVTSSRAEPYVDDRECWWLQVAAAMPVEQTDVKSEEALASLTYSTLPRGRAAATGDLTPGISYAEPALLLPTPRSLHLKP